MIPVLFCRDFYNHPLGRLWQINAIASLESRKTEKLGDSPQLTLLASGKFKLDPKLSNSSSTGCP